MTVFGPYIAIGIPPPEGVDPRDEFLRPVADLRKEITRGRRDSSLIRNCQHRAEIEGLNGEDHMTLLAYCALRMLEDATQRELTRAEKSTRPTRLGYSSEDETGPDSV